MEMLRSGQAAKARSGRSTAAAASPASIVRRVSAAMAVSPCDDLLREAYHASAVRHGPLFGDAAIGLADVRRRERRQSRGIEPAERPYGGAANQWRAVG